MRPDTLTLAFDTSAAHCAAALLSGDRVLAERLVPMQKGQAENLFPLLEGILGDAGKHWRDLTYIGVGIGPGNFTGIRISVAAARGLALSLAIPAIGVSIFEAQAHGLPRPILSLLDARRGKLYAQHLPQTGAAFAAKTLTIAETEAMLSTTKLAAVGLPDTSAMSENSPRPVAPLAVAIAQIATMRAMSGTQPRPAPLYVRQADAAPPKDPAPVILS